MPSEQEKETAFLRSCLRYDESDRGRLVDERIAQAQRNDSSLRRARSLVRFLAALAVAGLGYVAVFKENYVGQGLVSTGQYATFTHLILVLLLGSMISLLVCAVLGAGYRRELNRRREEVRQRVAKFLESRLGEAWAARRNGRHPVENHVAARNGTGLPESGVQRQDRGPGNAPAAVESSPARISTNHTTEN